jgi:hypothetical protein
LTVDRVPPARNLVDITVDREARGVVEALIDEGALAVHLEHGDQRVPVGDGAPSGPSVEVDAGEAERRRDQRGR